MTILHKASLGLVALAALGQTGAARATSVVDVTPPTVTSNAGVYSYSYGVKPVGFDASVLGFAFSDSNVSFKSDDGPLSVVSLGNGTFAAGGGSLSDGQTENFVFTSPDGSPTGTLNTVGLSSTGIGFGNQVAGPGTAPVPEASTTVSLGLLLALGLGGVVVSARKKKLTA